jgi:glutaredoxin-related protein
MNKNIKEKGILIFIIVVTLSLIGLLAYVQIKSKKGTVVTPGADLLFYSAGCPACAKVETFLKDNNVASKLSYQKIEVDFSSTNKELFLQKQTDCKYTSETGLGSIPFLYTKNSQCLLGEVEITDYFKKELGI